MILEHCVQCVCIGRYVCINQCISRAFDRRTLNFGEGQADIDRVSKCAGFSSVHVVASPSTFSASRNLRDPIKKIHFIKHPDPVQHSASESLESSFEVDHFPPGNNSSRCLNLLREGLKRRLQVFMIFRFGTGWVLWRGGTKMMFSKGFIVDTS